MRDSDPTAAVMADKEVTISTTPPPTALQPSGQPHRRATLNDPRMLLGAYMAATGSASAIGGCAAGITTLSSFGVACGLVGSYLLAVTPLAVRAEQREAARSRTRSDTPTVTATPEHEHV